MPIRLNTSFGREQFSILQTQFKDYKSEDSLDLFQERCLDDYKKMNDYLRFFLEDDVMSRRYKMDETDVDGWKMFNEMSDMVSCLLYFSGYDNKRIQLGLPND